MTDVAGDGADGGTDLAARGEQFLQALLMVQSAEAWSFAQSIHGCMQVLRGPAAQIGELICVWGWKRLGCPVLRSKIFRRPSPAENPFRSWLYWVRAYKNSRLNPTRRPSCFAPINKSELAGMPSRCPWILLAFTSGGALKIIYIHPVPVLSAGSTCLIGVSPRTWVARIPFFVCAVRESNQIWWKKPIAVDFKTDAGLSEWFQSSTTVAVQNLIMIGHVRDIGIEVDGRLIAGVGVVNGMASFLYGKLPYVERRSTRPPQRVKPRIAHNFYANSYLRSQSLRSQGL
ncbi:hypothetical protein B0H16DRAFT_1456038 [Mycena metata]|uniref:Uncharacterized protein n=1 Tax=Mycena metata TaxID=1033252 RepID=A0AAD7NGZ7_9AGAR|nr:hypothetical protein B0H16DRAFT_1456038 [Mycena metata]